MDTQTGENGNVGNTLEVTNIEGNSYYSATALAKVTEVTTATVYTWVTRGKLTPAASISRPGTDGRKRTEMLFLKSDVDALLANAHANRNKAKEKALQVQLNALAERVALLETRLNGAH